MAFLCKRLNFISIFRKLSPGLKGTGYNLANHLKYSSKTDKNSCVVLTDNGQIIVCWHPEEAPPYEHTKLTKKAKSAFETGPAPLPVISPEFNEEDSVLKVQYRRDAKHRFQPDGPSIPELSKLTYTTKHRWFPKSRKKKLEDPNPPRDREGI